MNHSIPEFIPAEVGLGDKVKLTIRGNSSVAVPSEEVPYRKSPSDNESLSRRIDAYFLGILLALYQGRPFERGNLDAGRLNRLVGAEILLVDGDRHNSRSSTARLRVDLRRALALFEALSGSSR